MLIMLVGWFQVAETLIKKVLAPSTQKTKLIQAKEVRISALFVLIAFCCF